MSTNANIIAFSIGYYPADYIDNKNLKDRRLSELKENYETLKSQVAAILGEP